MVIITSDLKKLQDEMFNDSSFFGVLTDMKVPRLVYVNNKGKCKLRDSHSGLAISTKTTIPNGKMTVEDFVDLLMQ